MTSSQHLLEFNRNLQRRVAQVEQDNQHKKAELAQLRQEYERLQQSEARYRQLFENAPVSMLFINTEGYITQMNRAAQQQFGATMEQLNKQACPIFANTQLVENGTLPYMLRALAGETVIEEPTYYDTSKDFDGGKFQYSKGHYCPIRDSEEVVREIVEIGPDFSDLLAVQQKLQQERERAATERIKLLNTIAQVANLLLRSSDYTNVLPNVVRLLGSAVGSDRCTLTQDVMHSELGVPAVRILTEWCRESVPTSIDCTPNLETAVPWDDFAQFRENHLQGVASNFLIADLQEPARSILLGQGLTSLLVVPIMVQGKCWGEIGFDNCGTPRLFDEAEVAILRIAADSIAAAIERREKDEELRRSEALYRSLFEISNEGIYRWQLDQPVSVELPVDEQVELVYRYHSFAQANDALAKMYGLAKAEDIVGMRLAQVHPQDSAITLEMMRAICGNGWQIRNAESEEIDANGQRRYYLNSIISFIENGSVSSGWGTQIDITELREAQQALLQAEQARAELLKTMTTIANHLLRSTDYRLILPDVLQMLGEAARADRCGLLQNITAPASGKSAVRINAEWCRPGIQASIAHTPELESALLWSDFAELYERLILGETVQFFGTDLGASLRELFEAQGNKAMLMVPIVVQGEFWGVFGFDYCGEVRRFEELDQSIFAIAVDSIAAAIERQQQDDALRESEKRYRTLFEMSNEGIYRFELASPVSTSLPIHQQVERIYQDFYYAEVNYSFATQVGLENPEDAIGKSFVDFLSKNSELNRETLCTLIENGYQVRNAEWESIDTDNQPLFFIFNIVSDVRDGYLWGGWGTQTDITKLKQAQKALLQAEQARLAELTSVNDVLKRTLDSLVTDPNLDQFLGQVLRAINDQLHAVTSTLWFWNHDTQLASLYMLCDQTRVTTNSKEFGNFYIEKPYSLQSHPTIREVLQTRRPVVAYLDEGDVIHSEHDDWMSALKIQALLVIPLLQGDQVIGSLNIHGSDRHLWEQEDLELAQALGQQASLAVQLTRLAEQVKQVAIAQEQEKAAQQRAAELAKANAVLRRTAAQLTEQQDLNQFVEGVLLEVAQETGARVNAVFLYNPQSETLLMQNAVCDGQVVNLKTDARFEMWRSPVPANTNASWQNIQSRGYSWHEIEDNEIQGDEIWDFSIAWHRQMHHCTTMAVFLQVGDQPLGFMGLCFCERVQPSSEQIELILALAQQAALAIQLTQLAEQSKQAAIAKEQEKAASLRAAELAKANKALQCSLSHLTEELDLDSFLGQILMEITQQLGAALGHIFLYDTATNTLELCQGVRDGKLYQETRPPEIASYRSPFPVESTPAFRHLCQQRAILTFDTRDNSHSQMFWPDTLEWHREQGHRQITTMALMVGEQPVGILGVAFTEQIILKSEALELMQALAQQATLAIQLTHLAIQSREAAILEERNRIAREIHDTLAQAFTGISIHLGIAHRLAKSQSESVCSLIEQATELAHVGLTEARRSVWELQPDADEYRDLVPLLERVLQQMTSRTAVRAQMRVQGTPYSLPPDVGLNLLRIGQEALTNALKYAQAQQLIIKLQFAPASVSLRVQDDGCGFDPNSQTDNGGFGLVGMQQRCQRIGGQLTINSQPGQGTAIVVEVPLVQGEATTK